MGQGGGNERQQPLVGRQPPHRVKLIGGEPAGGFVLKEVEVVIDECAEVAAHGEVEVRVVPLNGVEEGADGDIGLQLFADFADEGLLRGFAGFDLPAREFPPVFPLAIAPLGS